LGPKGHHFYIVSRLRRRRAIPPLPHTCAVVVFHIVLEKGSGRYLSESTLSASAFKYTVNTQGICINMYVYRVGV